MCGVLSVYFKLSLIHLIDYSLDHLKIPTLLEMKIFLEKSSATTNN